MIKKNFIEGCGRTIIVGIVRNCERVFDSEYTKLLKACKNLNIVESYFVESDSSDNTLEILARNVDIRPNFQFTSLGELSFKIPNRIERIRFCRNQYIKYLRQNYVKNSFDYLIVADMDGINSGLTKIALESCFKITGWDALFSNQLIGISDVLALRADNWITEDYSLEIEKARVNLRNSPDPTNKLSKFMKSYKYDQTRKQYIYRHMRFIGIGKKLVPVDSAFGGIAIYKSWCIFEADYTSNTHLTECEHVDFHKTLLELGAKLFINPRFINSIINTYNINKFFFIRNIRIWRWNRQKNQI